MTYVGQQPATTFDSGIQDRFTSLTTNTVTLSHEISAEEDILVVWNNIVQDKNTYSVGGTGNKTLTLGGTLVSADVVTVYYLNKVMQSVNPTAGSVGITELNVSDGSNGQALTTNGSGTLSFADAGLSGWSSNSGNLLSSDSAKGIYLGVNSATASNLLHDYEEGEMASPIYIDNQQQTNYSSGRDKFSYIKIGRLVHCFGYVDTDGQTLVDTGTVELSLPFPVSANSSNVQNTGIALLNGYLNNKYWLTHIYLNADDTKSELNYAVGSTAENSAYYEGGGFSVLNASHSI